MFREDLNQHYHSTFGAIQESRHIFIGAGLKFALASGINSPAPECFTGHNPLASASIRHSLDPLFSQSPIKILEIGFGSGLNALMTLNETEKQGINLHYTAVEAFPLDERCWKMLNYAKLLESIDHPQIFAKLHHAAWNVAEEISPHFILQKIHTKLEEFIPDQGAFNLIYFDAFGPDAQPELWTEKIFRNLWHGMSPGGILVTYSVKGTVVRALRSAGFITEKLPGPPGKRHILRAVKT